VLSRAAGSTGMVGGQVMDMRGERERLSLDTLLSLHARKTGAMICASVQLGALAAGCEMGSNAWDALTRYAERIGLAFQVIDDVLDATADPALLGKSVGKDARADKTTFLTYYTIDEAKAYARELTDAACLAVEGIDREGTLSALARYLAERIY
jgi:geranylgeranyl pyrophosphate synthase